MERNGGVRRRGLRVVELSPDVGVRRLSSRLGVPRMTICKTLEREGLYPYHYQGVQHLHTE